jgi:hypothetical protein
LLRNWLSLSGLVIATGSLFSFLLLYLLDTVAHFTNPYIGVLTYLVAPGFLFIGLTLAVVGALWYRRQLHAAAPLPGPQIDLSRPAAGSLYRRQFMLPAHFRPRQLQDLPVHRVGRVLRPGLPHGDEAGTGHL